MMKKFLALVVFSLGVLCFAQENSKLNVFGINKEFFDYIPEDIQDYLPGDTSIFMTVITDYSYFVDRVEKDIKDKRKNALGDTPDIIVCELPEARMFIERDLVIPLSELGLTDESFPDQYEYTKDMLRNSKGELMGISATITPNVFIYRRDIAKEVFGTDDPEKIQKLFATWEQFEKSAMQLKEHGYYVSATYDSLINPMLNDPTEKLIQDGKIVFTKEVEQCLKLTTSMLSNDCTVFEGQWSEHWFNEMLPGGNSFGYFGPQWFIDFVFLLYQSTQNQYSGDNSFLWGVCKGPARSHWGESCILVAKSTTNRNAVKHILLSVNSPEIFSASKQYTFLPNSKTVLKQWANDSSYEVMLFDNQNPIQVYMDLAEEIKPVTPTIYDTTYKTLLLSCFTRYFFTGKKFDYIECKEEFYNEMIDRFPELRK